MTTNVLPITNVINVTVTDTPQGLATPNINSIALFTQDAPINLEQFGEYISPSQVAANYGTTSTTAQMANNIFAQLPNILSGEGQLVIIPMIGTVSATHGTGTTPNISANLAALIAVTNGDLKVTINGVATNIGNLNFTNCTTLAQIAAVIQAAMVVADCAASGNTLVFTSHKVGTSSTIAFASYAGGGTDLTGAGYLNTAAATDVAGANSSGETILAAIARTSGLVEYAPVMTTADLEDAAVETAAAGIQALDNIFLHHAASTQDIAGLATTISLAGQTKTRILTYTAGQHAAKLYKAAYAGRAFSVDFTGTATSGTMNLQQLANVVPDTGITQTLYNAAKVAGTDIYVNYQGAPSVLSTGGNGFFDNVYSDLALKFALEYGGFNYLRTTNTKVPQTEPGMNGLKDAYAQVMKQFVNNGCLAPGQWNSSETFGDPVIFNNNITNAGFYIYSLPVAQQNAADRSNRIAPLVQIAAKRAGAIQVSNVLVVVNS
jgi:hypothetical protein